MRNCITDVVYAFYDEVSKNTMQYYVLPGAEWAERVFKSLVAQIAVGEPREYSFRLVGRFDGLLFVNLENLLVEADEAGIPVAEILRGDEYVEKVADNV